MTDGERVHALMLLDAGRYDEAGRVAGALLAREPDDATALTVLSHVERAAGRPDPAISLARRAIASEPEYGPAWSALAVAHVSANQPDAATSAAGELVRLSPYDWASHAFFSEIADHRRKPGADGLAAAREGVRLAPDEPEAHVAMGNALLRRKQRDAARFAFQSALRIDPMNSSARNSLAITGIDRTPARAAMDLADVVAYEPANEMVTHNLRVALGRIISWSWVIIFIGSGIALRLPNLLSRRGESADMESMSRLIAGGIAVVVVLALAVLTWRVLRTFGDRAGSMLAFVLRSDRVLVFVAIVLALDLLLLLAMPFVPSAAWMLMIAVHLILFITGAIANVRRSRSLKASMARF